MKLKLTGVGKSFVSLRGRHDALDAVDLEIRDREFFVLLGPSGCGKSTLLNLIAGIERPTRGEILFDGRTVAAPEVFVPPRERNVAMVFQNYALYPHMNVFDNVAFSLRIQKASAAETRRSVESACETLKISGLTRAMPRELSGGERQRVAIARAIVRKPSLFLLDEPLSNLDAQLRAAMRDELRELHRKLGITAIYVTHDQVEAMTLGQRVAVLREGRLEQVGTPGELYRNPASPFVARFVGTPPMNLLQARIGKEGDSLRLMIGTRSFSLPDEEGGVTLGGVKEGACLAGIRPEHVYVEERPGDEKGMLEFQGRLITKEYLGRETLLHLDIEGQRLLILSSGTEQREGSMLKIAFRRRDLCFYESRSAV